VARLGEGRIEREGRRGGYLSGSFREGGAYGYAGAFGDCIEGVCSYGQGGEFGVLGKMQEEWDC